MFDHALRLRSALRDELRRSFPGLRCFVRIAPVGSPWLLVSDVPRQIEAASLLPQVETMGSPFVIDNGLLYLDAPARDYELALEIRTHPQMGSYDAEHTLFQATAALLLRHPVHSPTVERAKPLLREAWRAFALGDAQVRLWADGMRATLARGLREKETSGLYACGELMAAWLEHKGIPVPVECPVEWEE